LEELPWFLLHGALVWQVGLGVAMLAGLLVARRRAGRRALREAEGARARLGPAVASPAKRGVGVAVTLAGELEVTEGSAERFEDGAPAAAATAAFTAGRKTSKGEGWTSGAEARARGLSIRMGDAEVELAGPVEVVAGSREVRPNKRLRALSSAVKRRVVAALGERNLTSPTAPSSSDRSPRAIGCASPACSVRRWRTRAGPTERLRPGGS
jgi:hypothetical protein